MDEIMQKETKVIVSVPLHITIVSFSELLFTSKTCSSEQ